MKIRKLSLICAFTMLFAVCASVALFGGVGAKAHAEETPAVITLGGVSNWCSYLDSANPETSRIQVPAVNCTWDSEYATATDFGNYNGKVEDLTGKVTDAGLIIRKSADGKFRIDFKVYQNEKCTFIVKSGTVFTDSSEITDGRPASVTFNTNYAISYKVNAAPTVNQLGIITPAAMKWSASDTTYGGYFGYCAFEYTADGYNPVDDDVEMKGLTGPVYDLTGNSYTARMDVNFGRSKRIYLRAPDAELTSFVVRSRDVFTMSGKTFKFDKSYKFTWAPTTDGATTKCEVFDDSVFDKPQEPIAERLEVKIGSSKWVTDLAPADENGRVQISFASTKTGHHTATGVYNGKAEDINGNAVDLEISWDSADTNKLILKFAKKVDILVLRTTMEFAIKTAVTGAPEKVVFDKDMFITYVIGSSNASVNDISKLDSMKSTALTLGSGSYATDSNKEDVNARIFVSFNYCSMTGEFDTPSAAKMDDGVLYGGGKVYDRDGNEYKTNVDMVLTAMEEKDQTSESVAAKQFRIYIKIPKGFNTVFIKAGTVFQRAKDVDGTPFKVIIDKDYIVTYEADSDNVRFTPHLATFEAYSEQTGVFEGYSVYVENESKLTAPVNVTVPEGYRAEWVDADGNVFDFENYSVTSDVTVRLTLIEQVTVTFDSNGGTVVKSRTLDVNGKLAKPNDPLKASADVKKAFALEGWYAEGSDTPFDFENTAITEDITLTARWIERIVKASVTFNTDGGSEVDEVLVNIGEKAAKPADPVKEATEDVEYTFAGWYAEGSETPFDFENTAITEDITLTARWTETAIEKPVEEGCTSGIGASGCLFGLIAVSLAAVLKKKKA